MLNRIAQCAVRELAGLGVTNLTADEIVRLHILGDRQERAGNRLDCVIRTTPCAVGNAVLHPLTCAARDWLNIAMIWFQDSPYPKWWCVPFAMAHGRKAGILDELSSAEEADTAIRVWVRKLCASQEEVDVAVGNVLGMSDDCERAQAQASFQAAVSWIARRSQSQADAVEACAAGAFDPPVVPRVGGSTKPEEDLNVAREMEYGRWAVKCAELAAIAGGSPRDWYNEDSRLVVHAYTTAIEAAALRSGMVGGAQKVPKELILAIKAFREAVAEILSTRKNRGASIER